MAGNTGLVGSAIVKKLNEDGYTNLIFTPYPEYDLRDQAQVNQFFKQEQPDYVFLAAAKVGGILANSTYPAEFIYDNMMIACNVIHAAYQNGVQKLLNLGSSCIYPRNAPQPLKESYLLTSTLEPTNEPYAIAKIAAIKLCRYYNEQYNTQFLSVMPTNLYGPNDNFNLETSHVLPALIRKFHEAKLKELPEVVLWGTGRPRREFLYSEDLAEAVIHLMKHHEFDETGELINIGTGNDLTIQELAELIKRITDYSGRIVWDASKPDGTPQKLLDVTKINNLGWKASTGLEQGIEMVYAWFMDSWVDG